MHTGKTVRNRAKETELVTEYTHMQPCAHQKYQKKKRKRCSVWQHTGWQDGRFLALTTARLHGSFSLTFTGTTERPCWFQRSSNNTQNRATPALAALVTVAATARPLPGKVTSQSSAQQSLRFSFPHIHVSLGFAIHTRETGVWADRWGKETSEKNGLESVVFGQTGRSGGATQTPCRKPSSLLPSAVDCGSVVDSVTRAQRPPPSFSLPPSSERCGDAQQMRRREVTVGGQDTTMNDTHGKVIKKGRSGGNTRK